MWITHKGPKSEASTPGWARQIETFRRGLKLTQAELGKRLGVSTMSVSRWGRGILKVPANIYIKLGFDHTDALVSDHREYESISLAPEFAWRIIGVVLWWTGRAR
jgi:DNA-binding XRE family transcriptional regulator